MEAFDGEARHPRSCKEFDADREQSCKKKPDPKVDDRLTHNFKPVATQADMAWQAYAWGQKRLEFLVRESKKGSEQARSCGEFFR